jgi:hypothetical protein
MEFCKAPTLKSKEKDSINEHGSFILEIPQESCSFNTSSESAMLCAPSTHNHLEISLVKTLNFRRLVVVKAESILVRLWGQSC